MENDNKKEYMIGEASEILNVHPRTLRIYEENGLVAPKRKGGKRVYTEEDLERIKCLRTLIHDENLSIPGIKKLLEFEPCWKLKNCPEEKHKKCCELSGKKKKCWEFCQHTCPRSCENCEVYKQNFKK